MEYKLFPVERYENVTNHLRFNRFSSLVILDGSDVQKSFARILIILESGFAASFPDVIDPISGQ